MNDIERLASANERLLAAVSVLETLSKLTVAEWLIAVQHVDQGTETAYVWDAPEGVTTSLLHVLPQRT